MSNCSVRRNVCGPYKVADQIDVDWYNAVLKACALDEDVAHLKEGDETLVGSKGVNLSGGQKQRVALARALYAKNELMVFDDIFSALDEMTERKVFAGVFGDHGLARKIGATVLLATHSGEITYSL